MGRDLATRLPSGQSLAARLTRNALSAGGRGSTYWHQRWLLGRIRRPFGLAHLREPSVVERPDGAPEQSDPVEVFTGLGIPAEHAESLDRASGQSAQSRLASA
jgi:hypothetical protein